MLIHEYSQKTAESVRKFLNITSTPNARYVLQHFGIHVTDTQFGEIVTSTLTMNGVNNKPVIEINPRLTPVYENFVLSHMLGHIIERINVKQFNDHLVLKGLHMGRTNDEWSDCSKNIFLEEFANEFAYQFLLPKNILIKELSQDKYLDSIAMEHFIDSGVLKQYVERLEKRNKNNQSFVIN